MSRDFGQDVSYVYEDENYNYDTVVFQKEKPILDSELNLVQQLQSLINKRQMSDLPSGWLSKYSFYTEQGLDNAFYTQDPSSAKPELALVNGWVVPVTGTADDRDYVNLVELGDPPTTGNKINGVFLEVWRALLDPNESTNKPDPTTVIDDLQNLYAYDENRAFGVGENGLVIRTENGGQTWSTQSIDTDQDLNGIYFVTSAIGWLVGANGTIARSASSGINWTLLSSPTAENLNSVCASTQLLAWAVGDSGTILRTTNGVTWLPVSVSVTSDLNKVFFLDYLVGWIVGDGGLIMKSTDGGTTWTTQTSGTTEKLNSIHFYDLNYGFAVGDNGTILRTSDGGSSWVIQSGNIYDGSGYTTTTEDLRDVTMAPTLDVYVSGEEVTSQFDGTNKDCVVSNTPVTKGDGNGTITDDPSYVTVTINGSVALVDSLDGDTGKIVLNAIPAVTDTVKVSYWYRGQCAIFNGRAWIAGTTGTMLRTEDIGAKWIEEDPQTGFDLNTVDFISKDKGWTAGSQSIIRYTEDAGDTWTEQNSEALTRVVQRVYKEGNVKTELFLDDNSIHPDARVETTKRVQIQYRIRVIDGADPVENPEAGLSSDIQGLGPNSTGKFAYSNMGSVNGDYGVWRSKCEGTVDGFCYAVPMFFVNRRNSATYNASTNANGSNVKNTENIRPDLLVGTDIIDADVLDVRRSVRIDSLVGMKEKAFDLLSSNDLHTKFDRATVGGDRYGTELLQVDRVSGQTSDGGELISDITVSDASAGLVSSSASQTPASVTRAATTNTPTSQSLGSVSGFFTVDESRYSATYFAPGSSLDGAPIPGRFEGLGTNEVTFIFHTSTKNKLDDAQLQSYILAGEWVDFSSSSLKYVPSTPKLSKNVSGSGLPAMFYQGVLASETGRVLETWDTGVPDNLSYAIAYPGTSSDTAAQQTRPSTVEVHYFVTLDSTLVESSNVLGFSASIYPDTEDVPYVVSTVTKINSVTSGFSYKIDDIVITDKIRVTSATGYEFIEGAVVEIVASVLSDTGDANVRNGASLNFKPNTKQISTFCRSVEATTSTGGVVGDVDVSITDAGLTTGTALILGTSATETVLDLVQPFCWVDGNLQAVRVTGFGTETVNLVFIDNSTGAPTTASGTVTLQMLVQETTLTYNDDNNGDGLLIGYNHVPHQPASSLPDTMNVEVVTAPSAIVISNLGTGGGTSGSPYDTPIEHIPVTNVSSESYFSNTSPLVFNNFTVDTGFVTMPIYVPGSFGESITLSSPTTDSIDRAYYRVCSRDLQFVTEGLQTPQARKVYFPVIARVLDQERKFMTGEYVLLIFCRVALDRENSAGYGEGFEDSIAIYRLPDKPLTKV